MWKRGGKRRERLHCDNQHRMPCSIPACTRLTKPFSRRWPCLLAAPSPPLLDQFIEETERSLHDAIMIVRRAIKNDTIVAGGGAIEVRFMCVVVVEVVEAVAGNSDAGDSCPLSVPTPFPSAHRHADNPRLPLAMLALAITLPPPSSFCFTDGAVEAAARPRPDDPRQTAAPHCRFLQGPGDHPAPGSSPAAR